MGYSQYLYAIVSVCPNYESDKKNHEILSLMLRPLLQSIDMSDKALLVKIPVGYWKNAFSIDDWFCTGGASVDRDDLRTLKDLCQNTLSGTADEIIANHFLEDDEDFKQNLVDTIEIVDKVLNLPDNFLFEYESH